MRSFVGGHPSWGLLWQQHNEQRAVIPGLVYLASATWDHWDPRRIELLGAAVFVASWIAVCSAHRRVTGRVIPAPPLLLLGVVWFSLSDDESALWAVQFGWYVALAALATMLVCLAPWRRANVALGVAICAVTIGSFSALQGLMLWPVGLLCLVWRRWSGDAKVTRGSLVVWLGAAVACNVAYLTDLNYGGFANSGPLTTILGHPLEGAEYVLVLLGSTFSVEGPGVGLHEVIGAVVALVALGTVVRELLDRRRGSYPFSTAVILFALLFDLSAAVARSSLGADQAASSRYTMANLLILIAVAMPLLSRQLRAQPRHAAPRHRPPVAAPARAVAAILAVVALLVQVGMSTRAGLHQTRTIRSTREACAQLTDNLDRVAVEAGRAEMLHICGAPVDDPIGAVPVLARYHLAQFAPSEYRYLRSLGPPP